ncbi:MAG: dTDP-4-dehydrorhamnose reductase, partial [Gemmatimonadetes bacterium]|nr:dTDP-4-dehydrorhamnose reductase [Gemmatimonadota bacterium]
MVTGAGGMLARDVVGEMERRGHQVLALPRERLDVTDEAAVREYVEGARPAVVVQCAAYTGVDRAEEEEAAATCVNSLGTRNLAQACDRTGALLVYPSTDYVFSGESRTPYAPGDPPSPVNAYGRSKLAGERAALDTGRALVVRTSWLYGAGGANFVHTVARLAREKGALDVVADQVGRPTWAGSLALIVSELIEAGAEGIFHAT